MARWRACCTCTESPGSGSRRCWACSWTALRATGASVVYLDCRTVEPTERGCLAAAGQVDTVDALVAQLGELPQPVLLVLDHYELFRLMDTWLRRVLVPSLPPGGRLVLVGRESPVAGWFADLGGEFRSLTLGPLGDDDARALLEVHGARAADAVRLNRIARGHPLALILAAAGVTEHPELALEDAATARVIAELTRLYLADVQDPMRGGRWKRHRSCGGSPSRCWGYAPGGRRRGGHHGPAPAAVRRCRP